MRENVWSEDRPTTVGKYWFLGWPYGNTGLHKNSKPSMRLCDVYQGGKKLVYVLMGQFFYDDKAVGVWQPAKLPKRPATIRGFKIDD